MRKYDDIPAEEINCNLDVAILEKLIAHYKFLKERKIAIDEELAELNKELNKSAKLINAYETVLAAAEHNVEEPIARQA